MKTAEQTENPNVLSARICATGGAAVWSGVALLAHFGSVRVGAIELLFLFAPLVIVPLGLELRRVVSSTRFAHRIHERLDGKLVRAVGLRKISTFPQGLLLLLVL